MSGKKGRSDHDGVEVPVIVVDRSGVEGNGAWRNMKGTREREREREIEGEETTDIEPLNRYR